MLDSLGRNVDDSEELGYRHIKEDKFPLFLFLPSLSVAFDVQGRNSQQQLGSMAVIRSIAIVDDAIKSRVGHADISRHQGDQEKRVRVGEISRHRIARVFVHRI